MAKAALNLGMRTVVLIVFSAVFLALAILWITRFFSSMPF
jgi:hypothetical protein